jgi:glycosyltransferase involved in cell wall biosynthesis
MIWEKKKFVVQLFNGASVPKANERKRIHETDSSLAKAGLDVTTILPFSWPWNPFAKKHNAFRGLDPLRAIRVLLTQQSVDLVCAHLESAAVLILAKKLFLFRPPILIWEVPWSPGWKFREKLSQFVIPRADYCVVFSKSQIGLIHKAFGRNVPTAFIGFCLDTEFFKPRPAHKPSCEFIWSCGLDEGRDFSTLLEASRTISTRFLLKTRSDIRICPTEFPNVTQEISFLPLEAFRDRYANASVVVICTKATPNASGVTSLMEALSMGRPTIVTDNPALRDYIPPDGAIVVPVGDTEALRAAISALLADPEAAEAMGKRGRQFAEEHFSRVKHYNEMANVFNRAIDRHRARNGGP